MLDDAIDSGSAKGTIRPHESADLQWEGCKIIQ